MVPPIGSMNPPGTPIMLAFCLHKLTRCQKPIVFISETVPTFSFPRALPPLSRYLKVGTSEPRLFLLIFNSRVLAYYCILSTLGHTSCPVLLLAVPASGAVVPLSHNASPPSLVCCLLWFFSSRNPTRPGDTHRRSFELRVPAHLLTQLCHLTGSCYAGPLSSPHLHSPRRGLIRQSLSWLNSRASRRSASCRQGHQRRSTWSHTAVST